MATSRIDAYHQQLIDSQKPAARIFAVGRQPAAPEPEEIEEEAEVSAKVVRSPKRKAPTTTEGAETA
jgi:hypothetical protein